MPNTASARKRLRQNEERRLRNRAVKSAVRTQMNKVIAAVSRGEIDVAESDYREAAKRLDRAGARNIIHRNAAARRKSRLHRLIKQARREQAGSGRADESGSP
jgi:small subunit ribosomal protein S20